MTIDPAYYQLSDDQKQQYLAQTDKDYASLQPGQQSAYRQHLEGYAPPRQATNAEREPGAISGFTKPGPIAPEITQAADTRASNVRSIINNVLPAFAGASVAGPAASAMFPASRVVAPTLGRAMGSGMGTAATTPGDVGDRAEAGAKSAGASVAGEGVLRALGFLTKLVGGSSAVKRGLEGAFPPAPKPAVPPGNPVTTTNTMAGLGEHMPGSPAAPKYLLNPQGQVASTVHSQPVMDELAQHGIPAPLAPGKDLLVTRTPTPGSPAVPESLLDKVLKTGAVSGVSQDPSAQQGAMGLGLMLSNVLSNLGQRWGFTGRDPNHTGPGK